MKNDLQGMTLPTCEIFVNGQLRKLYGKKKNKVYLHNEDNFQLKFFNPLRERIGVQLCMNGVKVDNDLLIINPGQEITIDRYIGTNRKLTFSAYDIDTSNMSESRLKETKKAIEKNGVLEVVFWNEKNKYSTLTGSYDYHSTCTNSNFIHQLTGSTLSNSSTKYAGTINDTTNTIYGVTSSRVSGNFGTCGTSGISNTTDVNIEISNFTTTTDCNCGGYGDISNTNGQLYYLDYIYQNKGSSGPQSQQGKLSKKIKTGRIEKGEVSNQYFSSIKFEVGGPFYRVKFKLLPFSMKPVKKKTL